MSKFMEAVGYLFALVGVAWIIKRLTHEGNCPVCNLRKKVKDRNRKGSRYGSNPIRY
ncbi:MAG: hypothetical protein ACPK85_05035 [Methanosarcina sp.]